MYEKCEDKDHLCKAAAEQKRFIPPLRTTFYSFIIKPETMQIKNASIMLHSFYSDARCEYSLMWHSRTVRKPVRQIVLESLLCTRLEENSPDNVRPAIADGWDQTFGKMTAIETCWWTLIIAEKSQFWACVVTLVCVYLYQNILKMQSYKGFNILNMFLILEFKLHIYADQA